MKLGNIIPILLLLVLPLLLIFGVSSIKQERIESFSEELSSHTKPLYLSFESLFKLSEIEVAGNRKISEQSIINTLFSTKSPWLWNFPLLSLKERFRTDPWIDGVELDWQIFPTKLLVRVRENIPWLVARHKGSAWIISSNMQLLQSLDSIVNQTELLSLSHLVRVELADNYDEGLGVVLNQIKLLEAAGGLPFEVEQYKIERDGSLIIEAKELDRYPRINLRVNSFDEASAKLKKIELVLGDLAKSDTAVRIIDLRFRNRVITK